MVISVHMDGLAMNPPNPSIGCLHLTLLLAARGGLSSSQYPGTAAVYGTHRTVPDLAPSRPSYSLRKQSKALRHPPSMTAPRVVCHSMHPDHSTLPKHASLRG